MKPIYGGIALVALTTLMLEIVLTRTFDVILYSNTAFMVITCALFGFGLAGIYSTLRPMGNLSDAGFRKALAAYAAYFALTIAILVPLIEILPFNYELIAEQPLRQFFYFSCLYLGLVLPFFLSGLVIAAIFSRHPTQIQQLYFFDLAGAAIGCVAFLAVLPAIGTGGLVFCAAALAALTAALFATTSRGRAAALGAAALFVLIPWIKYPAIFDFSPKIDKRGVAAAYDESRIEFVRWDPVSKIEVIDASSTDVGADGATYRADRKHVAYDGGSQSTHIYSFDGDFQRIRDNLPSELGAHFWTRAVLASHYLKRDTGHTALIIGSAGGQETKAALMYGAGYIDAVEMVGTVVELGLGPYAEYNGGVFLDPRVNVYADEGRSFLRRSQRRYDIVQIHSTHTSSTLASGSGAMGTAYLQTVEAYKEYFSRLSEDGVLHVNHHIYPRMIATAAAAWRQMGRTDFRKHVIVFQRPDRMDTLPTLLIKMQPWTRAELAQLEALFYNDYPSERDRGGLVTRNYELAENPFDVAASFLPEEVYSGELSSELLERAPYKLAAATDDLPYFNFLRKEIRRLEPDQSAAVNVSVATHLNRQLRMNMVPMDLIHLLFTGTASLVFAVVFFLVPLRFSAAGRAHWPTRWPTLSYFSCLGAGFIIIELIYIQIFMKLIGPPLYTYSTVLFSMLLGASLGSGLSERLGISPTRRWAVPFAGVVIVTALTTLTQDAIATEFLASPLPVRMLTAALLIFPSAFFLGMPFPLGILAIRECPQGAVAWAWGLNGLFTVFGSILSVLLSLAFGFKLTLAAAILIYGLATLSFMAMRRAVSRPHTIREQAKLGQAAHPRQAATPAP